MNYDELIGVSLDRSKNEIKGYIKDEISIALEKFFNNVIESGFTKENELLAKL